MNFAMNLTKLALLTWHILRMLVSFYIYYVETTYGKILPASMAIRYVSSRLAAYRGLVVPFPFTITTTI